MNTDTRRRISSALVAAAQALVKAAGRGGVMFYFREANLKAAGGGSFVVRPSTQGEFTVTDLVLDSSVDVRKLKLKSSMDENTVSEAGVLELEVNEDVQKQMHSLVNSLDLMSFIENEDGTFPIVKVTFDLVQVDVRANPVFSDGYVREPLSDGFHLNADTKSRGLFIKTRLQVTKVAGRKNKAKQLSRREAELLFSEAWFKPSDSCHDAYDALDFGSDDEGDSSFSRL